MKEIMNKSIILFFIISLQLHSEERLSSEPYISGDTFRKYSDFIFDETQRFDPVAIKKGDIIFLATGGEGDLKEFFTEYHPKIKHPYILITHNGDRDTPGEFKNYLEDKKIFMWFGQNMNIKFHKKFIPIPIGFENKRWKRSYSESINELTASIINRKQKSHLLYGNFNIITNHQIRQPIFDIFKDKSFCYFCPTTKSLVEYLKDIYHSKFVLSPHGNGLDCHRTWEVLCLGSFPIVKTSTLDRLYDDLPVLIVNDWNKITKKLLEQKFIEMSNKKYKKEKLYFNYWWNLILSYKKQCKICSF